MTSLRSLTRQPTISGYLMDFILYNFKSHEFKQHLEYCMPDGTVNQRDLEPYIGIHLK
jgi:hypothetical protein